MKDKKKLPIIPAYVLFGLIFDNFGPLNNLPKIYPPISVKTHIIIKVIIIIKMAITLFHHAQS